MPDCLRFTCMLVCAFLKRKDARETAGAACTRHSLRPLYSEGATREAKLGRIPSRERDVMPPSLRGAKRRSNPDCRRGDIPDCFAEPVIRRRFAPTGWLAMTMWKRLWHRILSRLARPCAGHPRLSSSPRAKTWMAGHRRAEATPSFGRLCPAMTHREAFAGTTRGVRPNPIRHHCDKIRRKDTA
jgi:hypothetical protein